MLRVFFTGLAALLLAGCAPDATADASDGSDASALELTGRVVDTADILPIEYEAELANTLAKLERDTGVQLFVATTPSLEGSEIAEYAMNLGNDWGIGDAERNDGLLLLIAPNDRRVHIAVGLGLEETVTDQEAQFIIDNALLPHFQTGDYQSGIDAGVEGLIGEVTRAQSTPAELKEAA